MRDLIESREAIGKIDEQIASLFVQRMTVVRDVAQYKFSHNLPIADMQQEARVLSGKSVLVEDEELRPFFEVFLQDMMNVSKSWQSYLISGWNTSAEKTERNSQQ